MEIRTDLIEPIKRRRGDATTKDLLKACAIGGAKNRTRIMDTSHVMEHGDDPHAPYYSMSC
jgi:hypothetical protein